MFVSTSDGIAVVDLQGGTAIVAGKLGASRSFVGFALVDYGVAGERTLVALPRRLAPHHLAADLFQSHLTAWAGRRLDLNQPYISYVPFVYEDACSDPAADAGSGEVIASAAHPARCS